MSPFCYRLLWLCIGGLRENQTAEVRLWVQTGEQFLAHKQNQSVSVSRPHTLPDPQISAVSSEHRAASRAVEAEPAQPCWLQQDKLLSCFGQAAVRYPRATRRKERSL